MPHNQEITRPMLALDGQAPRLDLPPPPPLQGPAVNRSPECRRQRRGREGEAAQGSETPSGSPRTQGRSVPPVFSHVSTGLTHASCLPFHQESLTSQVGRESFSRFKTGLLYPNYLHTLRQIDGHSDTYLTCSYRVLSIQLVHLTRKQGKWVFVSTCQN